MNIKIQGGGSGRYSNKGSCIGLVSYLQHEDMERAIEGNYVEPFFNADYDKVNSKEVVWKIDHNKAQLHKNDSKFFVITVSPSQDELKVMGRTPQERAIALKEYVRADVMQRYAENFNKNLNEVDIMYYAKIHHDRGAKIGDNMHAHVIVSRKDIYNEKKLSPQTNHRQTKKGAVKGGFDREQFVKACESSFNKSFKYNRSIEESFEYCNAMKNGSLQEIKYQVSKSIESERSHTKEKSINKNKSQEKGGFEL